MESVLICFIALLVIIVVGIIKGKVYAHHYFLCRHCGKKFQPMWTKVIFEIHAFDEFQITCPYCGKKDFCKDLGKQKDSI